MELRIPTTVYAGEVTPCSCTSSKRDGNLHVDALTEECTVKVVHKSMQRIEFNLTCKDGSYSTNIECITSVERHEVKVKGKMK